MTPTNNFNDLLDSFKTDFEDLVLSIQGKRVIFFVGAGISRAYPTNLETAKDLVSRFKDLFGSYGWWTEYFNPSLPDAKDKFYDEGFEFPRLEEIAELFLTRDQFPLFIDSLMQDSRWELEPPNVCHTVISELLIEEICQGVLTTNVDNRIETEHLRISDQSALHVISHDDFIARKEYQNDIYKIHGCLYQCPTRKYCSIWAKSQFSSEDWPDGVHFAEGLITDFCQRRCLVFVGFNTHAGYLEKTLSEAIENNNDLRLYCVLPCSIDSVDSKFRQAIFLSPERLIPLSGEEFFPIIRHIVFEDLLNKLFRTRVSQRKKYFKGGNAPIYQIEDSEFDRAKECVKHEIVKQDRTSFQRFLQEVLREQGRRHKYVSFRYQSDKMEVLFFWLTVLRLNYEEFIFCTTSFSHLLMQKDDREIPMLIVNGDNRDHIDLIYQQLNRQIEQDREFRHYIKNVFVYNAEGYTSQAETPAEVGSGRLIERDPHKVVNASSIDYFSLTDHKMYEFLREFDLERFRQNLDDQPWRL